MFEQNKKTTEDPMIGVVLADRYKIVSVLEAEETGVVYKAEHLTMRRFVAIKMLSPELALDEVSTKRFEREAKAISLLSHPHIVGLHDYGLTPYPYLVMDLLYGVSLADVLEQEKQISTKRAIHIFAQVCDALYYSHANGIIHKTLKPNNIILCQVDGDSDFVKVVDFRGDISEDSPYTSPEQISKLAIDARTDIYSLGLIMYEAITGKTINKNLKHSNLHIPKNFEAIISRAIEEEPKNRQQSMVQLKEELVTHVGNADFPLNESKKFDLKVYMLMIMAMALLILVITVSLFMVERSAQVKKKQTHFIINYGKEPNQ